MARRVSKSFKLAPGVRLRVGSKSSSLTVGGKSGRVTVNSKGKRTTTVKLGGVSATSTSSGRKPGASKATKAASPPVAVTSTARLGFLIAPRRSITGGWIASDDRAVVVRRAGREDLRIPHSQLTQLWIDGKDLAIMSSAGDRLKLRLTTLWTPSDLKFVQNVSRAAGLNASGY